MSAVSTEAYDLCLVSLCQGAIVVEQSTYQGAAEVLLLLAHRWCERSGSNGCRFLRCLH